ncbi:hypothetical protein C8F04DRAFT_191530 [Mycena alexandri]|uniref:Secreted protein n=1 Tax=Mycena alexandri TaxID=1745969 RepID=A0AAD6S8Z7_9AGAR|nr:hypothetical protein C8F04DRAFT_191530 [Mycena alexandri]
MHFGSTSSGSWIGHGGARWVGWLLVWVGSQGGVGEMGHEWCGVDELWGWTSCRRGTPWGIRPRPLEAMLLWSCCRRRRGRSAGSEIDAGHYRMKWAQF